MPGINEYAEKTKATRILIDHHLQPQAERAYEWWATNVSSTAELVYEFISDIGQKEDVDLDIATCLYTGIVADTNRFNFNTSKRVHQIAARLVEIGVDVLKVYQQLFNNYSENRLRLLGFCLLQRMLHFDQYHTAIIHLNQSDHNRFDYQKR